MMQEFLSQTKRCDKYCDVKAEHYVADVAGFIFKRK